MADCPHFDRSRADRAGANSQELEEREHRRRPIAALVIATAGGAGLAPVAPGTAGSLVGVVLFLLLAPLAPELFCLTLVGLVCLAIWAAGCAETWYRRKDDGRIVIDEVAGQLVALVPLLWAGVSFLGVVTAFVAFRCFDIWKPGPVRSAERRFSGGAGVVLDDLVAGLLAAVVTVGAVAVAGHTTGALTRVALPR